MSEYRAMLRFADRPVAKLPGDRLRGHVVLDGETFGIRVIILQPGAWGSVAEVTYRFLISAEMKLTAGTTFMSGTYAIGRLYPAELELMR